MKNFRLNLAGIVLAAAFTLSFSMINSPNAVCFASDDPPVQDGSKQKPKQGPDTKDSAPKETKPALDPILLLISWLVNSL